MQMRVYLDNCCFNRPFDDQSDMIVYLETKSKLAIQGMIKDKGLELVWSEVLDFENNENPFEERKIKILEWKLLAIENVEMNDLILETARKLLNLGFRQKDASHIACAIFGKVDFFVTTDKKILNKKVQDIELINPIDLVRRFYAD
jgi:predicted nucleic acid-binding protein